MYKGFIMRSKIELSREQQTRETPSGHNTLIVTARKTTQAPFIWRKVRPITLQAVPTFAGVFIRKTLTLLPGPTALAHVLIVPPWLSWPGWASWRKVDLASWGFSAPGILAWFSDVRGREAKGTANDLGRLRIRLPGFPSFEARDSRFPLILKLRIRDLKEKSKLKICPGGGIRKITLGITGLHEIV